MKLLFLTGSRSDWGYIKPILTECKKQKIKNYLCVTNMLLLDSFGYGAKEIFFLWSRGIDCCDLQITISG